MSVINQTQIANRVCQKVGAELIAAGALLTEDSKAANQIRNAYDILRRAELRRRIWRFCIRTTPLRPLTTTTYLVTFGTWVIGSTYKLFDVVTGDDGQIYFSRINGNIGNTPSTSPTQWELYFGQDVAQEFVTAWGSTFTYFIGDHTVGSDGNVYIALISSTNVNPVGDMSGTWTATTDGVTATETTFYVGELVRIGNVIYQSLQNNNGDGAVTPGDGGAPPGSTWQTFTTAPSISQVQFIYPIGSGPANDFRTKNVYRLPVGFLREAPQDPKAGGALYLGAPDGSDFNDWNFENTFFTSSDTGVIPFRFAADVQDVTKFDPMFVEGFVCRMGFELAEPITQSEAKVAKCEREYAKIMTEAGEVNGIETGAVYPPEDAYITCRF